MENLFYQPELIHGCNFLNEDESRHCIKVLRKKSGDIISITDGRSTFYTAVITEAHPKKCNFTIQAIKKETPKKHHIHLAVSPTKNSDRMEWMMEKCVELGIGEFTPLLCKNTERKTFKTDRLEKIAINAMKQSQRATVPAIHPLTSYSEFINSHSANETSRFIAHVDHSNPHHLIHTAKAENHYVVLIGPEGDFTPVELEHATRHGYVKVSLGNSRLRTETAGLAACHILNLINF
jgi:16S rRNA (uracil1498-N3)-methyltransferase